MTAPTPRVQSVGGRATHVSWPSRPASLVSVAALWQRERDVTHFFLVCLAGAVGTGARFALAAGVTALAGTRLPYGTILVNLLGSFAIGVVMQLAATGELVSPATRTILTTGFLGGFTTYSAFNHQTVAYLEQDLWDRALANVAITLVGCLLAGVAGVAAGRRFAA